VSNHFTIFCYCKCPNCNKSLCLCLSNLSITGKVVNRKRHALTRCITSAYTLGTKLHGPNSIRLYPVVNWAPTQLEPGIGTVKQPEPVPELKNRNLHSTTEYGKYIALPQLIIRWHSSYAPFTLI
jgi:hypothetical protein